MKQFEELAREQEKRESTFLSEVVGSGELKELADFDASASQRREEILFRITTEIEDTKNALRQAEQLVQRLKKYLERLRKIHQTLSK